jgi:hypothetical protein
MSVKSKLKTIGKVALKVAPYAAMAIPGVGPLAAMAISAGTSAASRKLEGGSWKDAALAGGIGGATGYMGAKIPVKGIGPSSGVAKAVTKGAIAKNVAKKVGTSILTNAATGRQPMDEGKSGPDWSTIVGGIVKDSITDHYRNSQAARTAPSSDSYTPSVSRESGTIMPRGGYSYNDNPMNQVDQRNPNLAQSIFQGRQQAIQNQPFRRGYDVTTNIGEPDAEGKYQTQVSRMPRIYSGNGRR